ncbi:class I SAM-dependent methyltransferase [Mesorhizobium sp. ORM8.1]
MDSAAQRYCHSFLPARLSLLCRSFARCCDAAAGRFADAVRAVRAEFRLGTVENLPLPDAAFDKALSVHTVYFWQSLGAGSAELARVQARRRVVLGFLPKAHMDRMNMPPDIFTPREPHEVIAGNSRYALQSLFIDFYCFSCDKPGCASFSRLGIDFHD